MKVICIDNNDNIFDLTIGKIYHINEVILYSGYDSYVIVDDGGVSREFLPIRFISIEEFRKNRINKLFIKNKTI